MNPIVNNHILSENFIDVCGENISILEEISNYDIVNSIKGRFIPPYFWSGWQNVMHGGYQSMLLERFMQRILKQNEINYNYKEIRMSFIENVNINEQYDILCELVNKDEMGCTIRTGITKDESGKQFCTEMKFNCRNMDYIPDNLRTSKVIDYTNCQKVQIDSCCSELFRPIGINSTYYLSQDFKKIIVEFRLQKDSGNFLQGNIVALCDQAMGYLVRKNSRSIVYTSNLQIDIFDKEEYLDTLLLECELVECKGTRYKVNVDICHRTQLIGIAKGKFIEFT
jgi:predicted transcriptional regulator